MREVNREGDRGWKRGKAGGKGSLLKGTERREGEWGISLPHGRLKTLAALHTVVPDDARVAGGLRCRTQRLSTAAAGPGKPFSQGLNSVGAEIDHRDAEGVERKETWEGVPSPSHRVCLGSVVSFPTGSGAEPGRKMDFMDI